MRAELEDLLKEQWLRARERGGLVWETKDHRLIPVKDMTDAHLANAIEFLQQSRDYRDEFTGAIGLFHLDDDEWGDR